MLTAAMKLKGSCSLEKAITNLDSMLKSRNITLPTKVCTVQAVFFFFPVVMYECKSWTLKKAEHSRIDAFELWCWLRLESPFNSKEIKPVNPKKAINPEYSLERLMLKLKLQYFGYLMQRTEKSSWKRKDPDAGKD